ncbi:MAG: helix-turn-helix domain-containing protein [Chloroflexi bacterium]|nr:helix-turn-helix domain-containing protein [Chloroflexota bacterium]
MRRRGGRPMAELVVTPEDRATLERWTTRRRARMGWRSVRAEIVLRCGHGCLNRQVARELRLTNTTCGVWWSRFVGGGRRALLDELRSGAPRRITDEQVEAVVVKTLESTPREAKHSSVFARWRR